jgi:hypothetical protein
VFRSFCENLRGNLPKDLKIKIHFKGTKLTRAHLTTLSRIFNRLIYFNFKKASLPTDSIKVIAPYLENPECQITTVHLEHNFRSQVGYVALVSSMKENRYVTKLFLLNT